MVQYEGVCGCPNGCFSDVGYGSCVMADHSSSVPPICVCSPSFTGADCSQPTTSNTCSLHGKIVSPSSKSSSFPFDYCSCELGFSGIGCETESLIASSHPWKTVFGSSDDVYPNDDYKDDHPVFNISALATLRIEIDPAALLNLLLPENLYTEDYAPATLFFDNGIVQETVSDVGFKVKGVTSRLVNKKGWNLKFNEFGNKGRTFFGSQKIGFKAGSVADDTLIKAMMYTDLSRAAGVPVQRASYATIYINGVYNGVYFMHEDIDPAFLTSRLEGDDGKGDMFKVRP